MPFGDVHRARSWLGLCLGLLASGTCLADDPLAWLARMQDALSSRNYEGVFVHEHAGQTETLQVIHRSVGGMPAERLVSMDGSGREFIRKGSDLLAYLPDQRAVLVEKSPDRSLVLGSLPLMDASLTSRYDVRELSSKRLLGRDTRVIAIVPRDEYRYGYRVWIDEATAMPLKTQLRDVGDDVVEQIVFTSLKLPAQVADNALEPAVDAKGFRWMRYQSTTVADSSVAATWQAEQLPPGFRMTARATQQMPGSSTPVTHLVFSDGLASVSVFVEMKSDDQSVVRSDVTRVGSSSAYSTVVDGHRVTVIGEVPPETVRAIANSLRSDGSAPAAAVSATVNAANGRASTSTSTSTSSTTPFGPTREGALDVFRSGAPGVDPLGAMPSYTGASGSWRAGSGMGQVSGVSGNSGGFGNNPGGYGSGGYGTLGNGPGGAGGPGPGGPGGPGGAGGGGGPR
ncbi:MAG: MucB/RseB C-terminal domain-containing protein [Steroidobacteraceae bacterium]